MIQANYHTHTKRCGHAMGEDETYIQCAIQGGFKVLGFSDHAPYIAPEENQRMPMQLFDDYVKSITSLKQKYQDQIEIHLGLEAEYYPSQWETLKQHRMAMEYIILGQHSIEYGRESSYALTNKTGLDHYLHAIQHACENYLCDYIAHPDVFLWSYPKIDESVLLIADQIADIANYYDIPLEINCGSGVHYEKHHYQDGDRYPYPNRQVFEIFAKKQCIIMVGLDVHRPHIFLDDTDYQKAMDIVKGLPLNIQQDYPLIKKAAQRKIQFKQLHHM